MIIVTGGAGFIGSNLVKGLNEAGETDIIVVDDLTQGEKHLNLNALRFADYLDRDRLPEQLNGLGVVRAIFHQGACADTTERNGRYMMENNYEYSKMLFRYAVEKKIPFLYASSAAVYGDGANGFREEPACEYPLNVYGYSKLAFDNFVRRHLPKTESQVLGLRYFNVYGPQENHKGRMASVAFHLFHQQKKDGVMRIFEGSEDFRRDFIHVDDAVAVNLHFWKSGKSGILNCGTGKARSFADMAKIMQGLCATPTRIENIPFPDDLKGKYQAYTQADLTNLRAAGDRKGFLSLEEGLTKYHNVLSTTGGYYR